MGDFAQPLLVSLKLAVFVTALLLALCPPAAALLAFRSFPGKTLLESFVCLPMALPPTVLGYYALTALSPNSAAGGFLMDRLGISLAFSFTGLVLVSCVSSLPFMLQPIKSAMEKLDPNLIQASRGLGKSWPVTFFRVVLPNIKPAILAAALICFAHTMGEFGAVLMVGGNISGSTRTASIAIYEKVETLDFAAAADYSMIFLAVSFVCMLLFNTVNRAGERK
jgi:molybdate transport system permease protein